MILIIFYLFFSELGYFTLVNTNGSLLTRKKDLLSKLSQNIRFAVSLDTLKAEKLPMISKNNCLKDVLEGIHLLKKYGLLMRVNMVVGKHNYDEIFDIIHFCQDLECDLKILDIVSVPVPFGKRGSIYQEVTTLEKKLAEECDDIYSHEYTRGFGTPCFRYRFGKTYVTVKNSTKGSHYDRDGNGICSDCQYGQEKPVMIMPSIITGASGVPGWHLCRFSQILSKCSRNCSRRCCFCCFIFSLTNGRFVRAKSRISLFSIQF